MRNKVVAGCLVALSLFAVFKLRFRDRAGPGTAGGASPPSRLLPLLRLKGTPRRKGLTHGRLLKESIRAWVRRLRPADPGLADFALKTCGEQMLPQLAPTLREEIEGIAEGAGIDFLEALYLNTRFELAAYHLVGSGGDPAPFRAPAAVGPGPELLRLFEPRDLDQLFTELILVVHEDLDPPLVLVCLPGMVGGFLGLAGPTAAALRPMETGTTPILTGVAWPILVRRLLEAPPTLGGKLPAPPTRAASVPMSRPDGEVGSLNLAPRGGTWYPGFEGFAYASNDPVTGVGGRIALGSRSASARLKAGERARRLLASGAHPDLVLVRLRGRAGGAELTVEWKTTRLRRVVRFRDRGATIQPR